jgi:hypothetical protein
MTADMRMPKDTRTPGQLLTMYNYVHDIVKHNPKIIIAGHNQVQNKACPSFDVPKYLESIKIPAFNIANWSSKLKI